jgi:hypothetical protein
VIEARVTRALELNHLSSAAVILGQIYNRQDIAPRKLHQAHRKLAKPLRDAHRDCGSPSKLLKGTSDPFGGSVWRSSPRARGFV